MKLLLFAIVIVTSMMMSSSSTAASNDESESVTTTTEMPTTTTITTTTITTTTATTMKRSSISPRIGHKKQRVHSHRSELRRFIENPNVYVFTPPPTSPPRAKPKIQAEMFVFGPYRISVKKTETLNPKLTNSSNSSNSSKSRSSLLSLSPNNSGNISDLTVTVNATQRATRVVAANATAASIEHHITLSEMFQYNSSWVIGLAVVATVIIVFFLGCVMVICYTRRPYRRSGKVYNLEAAAKKNNANTVTKVPYVPTIHPATKTSTLTRSKDKELYY